MPDKQWYSKNRQRALDYSRAWGAKNASRRALRNKCNRAAKLANARYPGVVTAQDIAAIIELSERICHWCKKRNLTGADLTIEHLQPLNDKRFLAVACRACNSARVNKTDGIRKTEEEKAAHQRLLEKKYRARNADKIRVRNHKVYLKSKELIKLRSAVRHLKGLDAEAQKKYLETHRAEARERARLWRLAHPKKSKAAKRKCYLKRKNEIAQKMREYYEANKEKLKAQAKARYEAKKAAAAA